MENQIEDFNIDSLNDTKFVHPVKLTYKLNGKEKAWEAVKSFDSVAILLYHEEKKSFLLVKQFRPPVYLNDENRTFTYELCAGIVDKDKDLDIIALEEIEEECGYKIPRENLQRITSFFTNVGVSGGKQTLYFANIEEKYKVSEGGGIHDEDIELHYLPLNKSRDFIYDETNTKTPGLIFSFYWFFERENNKKLF